MLNVMLLVPLFTCWNTPQIVASRTELIDSLATTMNFHINLSKKFY